MTPIRAAIVLSRALVACAFGLASACPGTHVALAFAPSASGPAMLSRITGMSVLGQLPVGSFDGVPYVKTYGVLTGVVDVNESAHVVGLSAQATDGHGGVAYTSQYEIVAPAAGATPDSVVLVDAENRGSALSLIALDQSPRSTGGNAPDAQMWAAGMGNGFLQNHATAYARVQWQSGATDGGDNPSVPGTAQGIGLVILRDFGRMLAGATPAPASTGAAYAPPTFPTRILTGISQSAWTVNTLLAEGFNVDPVTGHGVFGGAIAIDGTGNWLAINQLGARAGAPMNAYVDPLAHAQAAPLSASQLLSRPESDPFYIDVANYTDFYRVFASLTDVPLANPTMRRYDWPGPHHVDGVPASASGVGTFAPNRAVSQGGACNAGVSLATNPIGYGPYFRALVLELQKQLGVPSASAAPALPPSTYFALTAPPAVRSVNVNGSALSTFNDSIGASLAVPALDANRWPQGGVRTPDETAPIGQPTIVYPNGAQVVSVPPVLTDSIGNTCGNSGVFNVFGAAKLTAMYGTKANYLAQYDAQVRALVAQGYVLASDEQYMLDTAATLYGFALAGPPYNGGANF